jgi:hypothetical protein
MVEDFSGQGRTRSTKGILMARSKLKKKQVDYLKTSTSELLKEKLCSGAPKEYCFVCSKSGQLHEGILLAHLKYIDPKDITKGLMMDDPEVVWVCHRCSTQWKL